MQTALKLDQAFMNNVKKRQTAFLSPENYHYDILICKYTIRDYLESEHRKSPNNFCEVYCTNVT